MGTITQVHVNDDTFPIDYDTTQFNACLSVTTLKDNLAAITEKADDESYHEIILQKLNQVNCQKKNTCKCGNKMSAK